MVVRYHEQCEVLRLNSCLHGPMHIVWGGNTGAGSVIGFFVAAHGKGEVAAELPIPAAPQKTQRAHPAVLEAHVRRVLAVQPTHRRHQQRLGLAGVVPQEKLGIPFR